MKKLCCVGCVLILLVCSGCANSQNQEEISTEIMSDANIEESESTEYTVYKDIPFEVYFRAFSPIFLNETEQYDVDIDKIAGVGTVVITTEEDWVTFAKAFCPYVLNYTEPDFSKEYVLISADIISNSALGIGSWSVSEVIMENGRLCTLLSTSEEPQNVIYGINVGEKQVRQMFMNIVTVEQKDIPEAVKNVICF